MFDTSKDILYLVISFCVLWTTVFLCWMFYYVMRILRNANQIVEEFRVRLQALTEAINYVRGKVEHMSGLMNLFTSGVGGMVKKAALNKAKDWMGGSHGDDFTDVAKEAVDKAISATANKIKKAAKKVRK